jgi:hypothetical protein
MQMSDESKALDTKLNAMINVEDMRAVRLEITALERPPELANVEGMKDTAIFLGLETTEGWVWYSPTMTGFEITQIPDAAVADLDNAVAEWDKNKAAGTLRKRSEAQASFVAQADMKGTVQ